VVTALISLVGLVVAPLSTIVTSLLSVGVTITSAPKMLHLSSSAPSILPSIVLTSALPSSFSHPNVSLCHMYTSCNSNSLWGMVYKLEQKTPIGFVFPFDKNLISQLWFKMHLIQRRSSSKEV